MQKFKDCTFYSLALGLEKLKETFLKLFSLCDPMFSRGESPSWCQIYRNDPKFSDRHVWANSADPDQTAPKGAV